MTIAVHPWPVTVPSGNAASERPHLRDAGEMMAKSLIAVLFLVFVAVMVWRNMHARPLTDQALVARYAVPMAAPTGPMTVFHLGHSLVGRDMPAMLAQMAGHDYASQLGWGASLKQHWQGDVPGFAEENATTAHRPAKDMDTGRYGAVVLTEMVELRDAMRYHDSGRYLADWAARAGDAGARVYLYETWHRLDDPAGWLERIDVDQTALWEMILRQAMGRSDVTIHVIPGGQVMAAVVRRIEADEVPGLTSRADLFAKGADGVVDQIHLNDVGNYVIALTHYATLYHRSPVGLPYALNRADGTAMQPLDADAARIIQQVVWDVVTRYPATGVAQTADP
jgi:hypothetical protein